MPTVRDSVFHRVMIGTDYFTMEKKNVHGSICIRFDLACYS